MKKWDYSQEIQNKGKSYPTDSPISICAPVEVIKTHIVVNLREGFLIKRMKFTFIILLSLFSLVGCSGENPLSDSISMSPGTLGVSASANLNCSSIDVMRTFDILIDSSEFTIPLEDSSSIIWWFEGGFDFLDFRCVKIKKRYYMVSIDSDNMTETSIAIRSLYDRKRKQWRHAKKFSSIDEYNAEKAMGYLLENLPSCN